MKNTAPKHKQANLLYENWDEHAEVQITLPCGHVVSSQFNPVIDTDHSKKSFVLAVDRIQRESPLTPRTVHARACLYWGCVDPVKQRDFPNVLAWHAAVRSKGSQLQALRDHYQIAPYLDDALVVHRPRIGQHCYAVAAVAYVLAEQLGFPPAGCSLAFARGLEHDGGKIAEILLQRLTSLDLTESEVGLTSELPELQLLRQAGVPLRYAWAMCAGAAWTGHRSLLRFLRPKANCLQMQQGLLLQKVVHLADDIVSDNALVSPSARALMSDFKGRYFEALYCTGLASRSGGLYEIDRAEALASPDTYFLPYIDVLIAFAHAVMAEFAGRLSLDQTEDHGVDQLFDLLVKDLDRKGWLEK